MFMRAPPKSLINYLNNYFPLSLWFKFKIIRDVRLDMLYINLHVGRIAVDALRCSRPRSKGIGTLDETTGSRNATQTENRGTYHILSRMAPQSSSSAGCGKSATGYPGASRSSSFHWSGWDTHTNSCAYRGRYVLTSISGTAFPWSCASSSWNIPPLWRLWMIHKL